MYESQSEQPARGRSLSIGCHAARLVRPVRQHNTELKNPPYESARTSRLDDRQRLELAAQDAGGVAIAHPTLDGGGVNTAEISGENHVAVVKLGEARHLAILAARN